MRTRFTLGILLLAVTLAAGCKMHNAPPASRMMHPGPGVDGPGPGVLPPAMPGYGMEAMMPGPNVQILFARPESMQVRWDVGAIGYYDSLPLIVPGRTNFPQGGVYRLKLTSIQGRVGVELYPTLEIGPVTPRTGAYLDHNAIPIQFTAEDFDQVLSGNFVTKVIYLPDPEFQQLALGDVDTLVSTRLDAGVDPVVEADRRGAILAIVRIGNKDEQLPEAIGGGDGYVVPVGHSTADPGAVPEGGDYNSAAVGPQGNAMPVAYDQSALAGSVGGPSGFAGGAPPMQIAAGHSAIPNYISGVTAPPWGMTTSGTPIGLPGPPHIPFGGPAGLKRHKIRNFTPRFFPQPTRRVNMYVRQKPGMSYPRPANNMFIRENAMHLVPRFRQPVGDKVQLFNSFTPYAGERHGGAYCPDCQ